MHHDKFLNIAKNICLHSDEKAQVRAFIFSEIEQHTLASRWQFHGFKRLLSSVMAAVMLFVVGGAGMSYAAESALPGDVLYPIKVNVTEAFLLKFNKSLEAKARVQVRLASRRLEEAERLAEKSQLTAKRVTLLQERLAIHVTSLTADLRELSAIDAKATGSIAIDTTADMQAHENLLVRLHSENNRSSIDKLIREARKARAFSERMTIAADIENLAELTGEKAEQEIGKAKMANRARMDMNIAEALVKAEADLKDYNDTEASIKVKEQKAASALKKAKEASFMLRLPTYEQKTVSMPQPLADAPKSAPEKQKPQQKEKPNTVSSAAIVVLPAINASAAVSASASLSDTASTAAASVSSASSISPATSASYKSNDTSSKSSATALTNTSASASVPTAIGTPVVLKKTNAAIKKTPDVQKKKIVPSL